MDPDDDYIESSLLDLTDIPLDQLLSIGNPVLRNSLKRILDELDNPADVLAAFFEAATIPPSR
jgi:FXSXX-COOH protein